jgi:uncharacterized protein with ParB-like and HNH nuclease domain
MSNLQINTRVRRLFNYLNDFEEGRIQIPYFLRKFVWTNERKLELLDSLKNGYPIGSLTFWQPYDAIKDIRDKQPQMIGGYHLIKNENVNFYYILDGYQRLSVLFGCFIDPTKTNLKRNHKEWKEQFDIVYNLKKDKFEFNDKNEGELEINQIPLYFFTNGEYFYDFSTAVSESNYSENIKKEFIDRYKKVASKISSYDIPSVDLIGGTSEDIVEVFSRLNSIAIENRYTKKEI